MASLSAQLARLSRGEPARHGSKPSLLYDTAQAADTDIAATYALGLSGAAPRAVAAAHTPAGG
jgi:hypothetical protein